MKKKFKLMHLFSFYGWALLVVLIIIGCLDYFGVFNIGKDSVDDFDYSIDFYSEHCGGKLYLDEKDFPEYTCDGKGIIEVYGISDEALNVLLCATFKSGYITGGISTHHMLDNGTWVDNWVRICEK